MKKILMTGPNVLSNGVVNGRIVNVFKDFGSYLIVFLTLERIVFKSYERIFKLAAFVVFLSLLLSLIKDMFLIFPSDEYEQVNF